MSSDDYGKEVTEEEYTLEESELVGQLYPVLEDAHGNIIDGNRRLGAEPNWKREKLNHIDTEEKLYVAQAIANWNRRELTPEEKTQYVNKLAELYVKQGCNVTTTKNEVKAKIMQVLKLSSPTVLKYLDKKYKPFTKENVNPQPRLSATEVVRNRLGEETLQRLVFEMKSDLREEVEAEFSPPRSVTSSYNSKKTKKPTSQDYVTKQRDLVTEIRLDDLLVPRELTKLEEIVKPLERFNRIEVDILKELDEKQKEEILTTLLETEKRLAEWIRAIQG